MKISHLYIYPIKSLGGISLKAAEVTDRGFKYDRRWMLVDETNRFISQRTVAQLALLRVKIIKEGLQVFHVAAPEDMLFVPFEINSNLKIPVQIWDDTCKAIHLNSTFDQWFSAKLQISCRLVFMPDETERLVGEPHRDNQEINSFSDSYPFLMIGEKSLEELNRRMEKPLPMNRFRPNIVFSGGEPHIEDTLAHFLINEINFYGIKLSSRCNLTTINQDDAISGKEPLKTLANYRRKNNKIYFGQNLVHEGTGMISVGESIIIKELKESIFDKSVSA